MISCNLPIIAFNRITLNNLNGTHWYPYSVYVPRCNQTKKVDRQWWNCNREYFRKKMDLSKVLKSFKLRNFSIAKLRNSRLSFFQINIGKTATACYHRLLFVLSVEIFLYQDFTLPETRITVQHPIIDTNLIFTTKRKIRSETKTSIGDIGNIFFNCNRQIDLAPLLIIVCESYHSAETFLPACVRYKTWTCESHDIKIHKTSQILKYLTQLYLIRTLNI